MPVSDVKNYNILHFKVQLFFSLLLLSGASGRTRTGTAKQPRDFKSLVSTYSTTEAILVRRAGFEPATYRLEGGCSIQLS